MNAHRMWYWFFLLVACVLVGCGVGLLLQGGGASDGRHVLATACFLTAMGVVPALIDADRMAAEREGDDDV